MTSRNSIDGTLISLCRFSLCNSWRSRDFDYSHAATRQKLFLRDLFASLMLRGQNNIMTLYEKWKSLQFYIDRDSEEASLVSGHVGRQLCARGIWNFADARFETCFLPFLVAFPAIVAVLIILCLSTRRFLGRLPVWAKVFARNIDEWKNRHNGSEPNFDSHAMLILFALSLTGFLVRAFSIFFPQLNLVEIFPTIAWGISMILILLERPRTAQMSLLVLYCVAFSCEFLVVADGRFPRQSYKLLDILSLFTAFAASLTILGMPFRDPRLAKENIGRIGEAPSNQDRTPEDDLTVWRFMTVSWMTPLIFLGSKRQLNDEDVWQLGFEFQHDRLHHAFRELRGSVVGRLLQANGLDLMITSCLGVLEMILSFATPVLLQQLLRSMEDLNTPRRAAVTYAIISLVVRLLAAQSSVFSLWFCRRCYERSRGEMITMLHEKTLSRQIVGTQAVTSSTTDLGNNTNGKVKGLSSGTKWNDFWTKLSWISCLPIRLKRKTKVKEAKQPASVGKILNLLRNDVYEIAQRFWEFPTIIKAPLGLILSLILIWRLIGWPCLIGVVTIFVAQSINALITRVLLKWERTRRTATDVKLQKTSHFVEAIRHLRWYGWQDAWLTQIMDARQKELSIRIVTSTYSVMIKIINSLASGLFPVVAFWAYTVLAGQSLRIDIAFPALQLFLMLESNLREIPGLVTVLLNAFVAVGRIEDFMHEPNKAETTRTDTTPATHIELNKASFSWPGAKQNVLQCITMRISVGLTVICGEVGAGKSALLQAIMGELDQSTGNYVPPNEMIGYCAQTPWLQNMSIRENILFSSPYDLNRYKEVLDACALTPDLASFKHGDLSDIGENGIGLSGGQKARVALARAIYSRAKILLLDDPISALDHQTAQHVVTHCLGGPLAQDRMVILVTHRIELCQSVADQIVNISDGKASNVAQTSLAAFTLIRSSDSNPDRAQKDHEEQLAVAVPDKFMEEEFRAHGGVKMSVYWEYIKAGKLKWWFVLTMLFALYRVVALGETWFLKSWSEAYESRNVVANGTLFDGLPSPETNVRPWLVGFLIIAVARAAVQLFANGVGIVVIYSAGRRMFADIMTRVAHATFRFYDVTPVGRLMNRLTSDINTIDGDISSKFQAAAYLFIGWVSSIIVIASVTPVFLVFAFALTTAFALIFLRFLPTSQSLRRLEFVSLTPLMSNFGTLLQGLVTVRAFCAQDRFQDRVIRVTDAFQKMDHFYWSLQAWLMYRFDALSAFSTFILTVLALYTGISPGLTAFVLIAAAQLVESTHNLCRTYGQLQMDFVSVERIVELLHLDLEPVGSVIPPAWWPTTSGSIVFDNVTISYASHLEPALRNVSFTIPGGSTTAIIGRTGSGKSTLALALLATILPSDGKILIEDMDTKTVHVQTLRSRVTFLAQDPVLFPGSMRQNLDPLNEHSDAACANVLQLIADRHGWTLETQVDTGGGNLSQGQRQLVGLARALLRRSAIVILDEATASIDMETSMRIQRILREELKGSTIVTIAHRVEAVQGADYYIKLAEGRVLAQGRVGEMDVDQQKPTMNT